MNTKLLEKKKFQKNIDAIKEVKSIEESTPLGPRIPFFGANQVKERNQVLSLQNSKEFKKDENVMLNKSLIGTTQTHV